MSLDSQLIHCLRHTIDQASQCEDVNQIKEALDASKVVINELLLRQDKKYSCEYYVAGRKLLDHGVELLKARSLDVAQIEQGIATLENNLSSKSANWLLDEEITRVFELLQQCVSRLPPAADQANIDYLNSVTQWELKTYKRRLETVANSEQLFLEDPVFTGKNFLSYLKNKFPEWGEIKIHRFNPIVGGFCNKTYFMDVEDDINGRRELIVRAQQTTQAVELYIDRVENELPVLKMLRDEGYSTVAEPLWAEADSSFLGTTFLVSEKMPGRNLGTVAGANENETVSPLMIKNLVKQLYQFHQFDLHKNEERIKGTAWERWNVPTVSESIQIDIDFWRDNFNRTGIVSPLIERGLRWLEDNIPNCDEKPVLLHADFGFHNVLLEGDNVTAALDWEGSHIGDPSCDLSWLLACTGEYSSAEQILNIYQEAGGRLPSEYRMRYQEVFACVRVPIACASTLKLLEQRQDNIQYAVFGLKFMHHNTSRLIECIERAEAAKNSRQ